ncbi:MAG: ABC transporter permease [Bacilli bacterium]|nr:ABC transporter permease [Bacilli bacterium]MDD3896031.1 ABC transporter permease [Bacilli bacterium]MDD4408017.1 ABC transporter permease [Bacilli bacterium]
MKDSIIVAKFTATEMFKKKSFKITLAILLLSVIVGFNIPNIINLINNNNNVENKDTILVMDQEDIYKGMLNSLNQMELGYIFEITNEVKENDELRELLETNKISAAINITSEKDNIKLDYITEAMGLSGNILMDEMIFTDLYKYVKLSEYGLNEEDIMNINKPLIFGVIELGDAQSGEILVLSMGLCMILFFAIYYCAYQVSASITVEKTSKIIDTLITSTTPKSIIIGKTLGIGFVGLVEVLAIIITGFLSYKLFFPAEILTGHIDLSGVTIGFALVSIIYFLLGYTLYAFIYALCGSLVSKPEDVQQSGGLVAIVVLLGFYLAYFSMMNPASSLNKLATYLPISAPFSVPSRYITGAVSTLDISISIIILLLSIVAFAYISIKIYSSAIINYGTKFNLKTMIEMFKQNNN